MQLKNVFRVRRKVRKNPVLRGILELTRNVQSIIIARLFEFTGEVMPMSINVRELVRTPGARLSFRHELDLERLSFPGVLSYSEPPVGEGVIANSADLLTLRGEIRAVMLCECDRCCRRFEKTVDLPLDVRLAAELEDEEDPDYYLLRGDELDIDDLLESSFILGMDTTVLCREDCKGLCPKCGADLNEGDCGCRADPDPRLAVLEQLLDDTDQTN